MAFYEYKVIPAPRKAVRVKGAKGFTARFASALEIALNELAIQGWEYVRAESLPVDERQGLSMRKTESYQNVLIFRKLANNANEEAPVTALLEDQSEVEEKDNLFDDINEDFPEDEDTLEEVLTDAGETDSDDTSEDENTKT